MSLNGKVAVVTGASAGIGAAVAKELSGAGAKVVLTARRADRLEQLAQSLPGESATLPADIADPKTAQRLLDFATERFGRADILINNAGILTLGPIDSVDLDDLSNLIRINFESVVRSTYLFARAFKAQKSGHIINVTSIGAYVNTPMGGVYGGLKHALEAFTTAIRVELGGTGVRVGTIAPGTTDTEILDRMRARGQPTWDQKIESLQPEDVAAAVRFMLEQPQRANVARLLLFASAESV
jgi:serine 3-dehydrogenase (NADP+)